MDVGAKFRLLKQASIQQDKSLNNIKVSILERGQMFGLDECD